MKKIKPIINSGQEVWGGNGYHEPIHILRLNEVIAQVNEMLDELQKLKGTERGKR
jgi:hypothetical protein